MSSASEMPMPNAKIRNLDDGCVQITVGNISGTVSSHHLVEPKLRQLRLLWKANPDNWQ